MPNVHAPPPPLSSMSRPRSRGWSRRVIIALLATAFVVVASNVLVDPFSTFGVSPLKHGVVANERFNKTAHLLENIDRYDSLILGSSRMGLFSPAYFEELRPGRRYYNLGFMGATPREYIDLLRTLDSLGMHLEEVVLGIDMFSFHEPVNLDDPAKRHHPDVSGQNRAAFYVEYAFTSAIRHLIGKLIHHSQDISDVRFDFLESGQYFLDRYDHSISVDHEQFARTQFSDEPAERRRVQWIESNFADLEELLDLLHSLGTRVTAFVHPFHPDLIATIHHEDLAAFDARINLVFSDLVDFNDVDLMLDYRLDFYDQMHYREPVARRVSSYLALRQMTSSR